MSKINTRMLAALGVLTAMEIVLSRFLSISTWNTKIGFAFIPVALAAMLYGPLPAGLTAACADFIGAVLFPIGAYFPGFTLTAFLGGVVFGLFLHPVQSAGRVAAAVFLKQFVLGLLLNTFWISLLYGSPYLPLLSTRLFQAVLLGAVEFAVILLLAKLLPRFRGQFPR